MAFRGAAIRLEHMYEAILDIERFIAGKTWADYLRDRLARRAVERCIGIVSEASRRLPADLKARYPAIPWSNIAGIGNILRHDYDLVDDREMWEIATRHLGPLKAAVEQLLAEIDSRETE